MKHVLFFAPLLSLIVCATNAEARSFRDDQLPNGVDKCQYCHVNANGGGGFNPFGTEVQMNGLSGVGDVAAQDVVWLNVCSNDLDSDNDGYPNGVELGDPQCTWVIGDANPNFTATNPGDPMQTPCGNGSIEAPYEDCDGISLGGQTCIGLGLPAGILRCDANCKFDATACVGSSNTNNATNNATNNGTGNTNNQTNTTNNATNNGVNNQPGNNNTGNMTTPTDPGQTDNGDKIEPFFCDGEMDADQEYKDGATAIIGIFLAALFRRRLFQ